MKRKFFNFAAAVSLVFCLATVGLWVRSYQVVDLAGCYRYSWVGDECHPCALGVYSEYGGLRFFYFRRSGTIDPFDHTTYLRKPATQFSLIHERVYGYPYMDDFYPGIGRLGFGFYHGSRKEPLLAFLPHGAGYGPNAGAPVMSPTATPVDVPMRTNDVFVLLPQALVVLLTAVLPLRWAIRRRRPGEGLCSRCGYSLTGNTSGVCPECGTPVAGKVGDDSCSVSSR